MYIFLIVSIIFAFWLRYEIKKANNLETKKSDDFWKNELEANYARPKDISNLPYIKVPCDKLPFHENLASELSAQKSTLQNHEALSEINFSQNCKEFSEKNSSQNCEEFSATKDFSKEEELLETEDKIRSLASKQLLNLNGISNTELKLQYGARNFDVLAACDQNYLLFIRTLNKWAHLVYELGEIKEARTILEYSLSIGSDITASYLLLASIYKESNCPEQIDTLIKQAEALDGLMKEQLLEKLHAVSKC